MLILSFSQIEYLRMNEIFFKKRLKLLSVISLLLSSAFSSQAYDFEQDGIFYNIIDDDKKEVEVTYKNEDYASYSGNLVLPSEVINNETTYSVVEIGEFALRTCMSLNSIEIPNSIISIGKGAFYACTDIQIIKIPDSVISIGDGAFYKCFSLIEIEIPESVTSIGEYVFSECYNLKSVILGASTTSIGYSAFYDCLSLTDIVIPNSVTSIGDAAFMRCSSLVNIEIPKNISSIGYGVFSYCLSLLKIVIPESVTSIGEFAFSYCTSLESVEIPSSVTSIRQAAFSYCLSLKEITSKAIQPPLCEENVFFEIWTSKCNLYVPEESLELYSSIDPWSGFNILVIGAGVETISSPINDNLKVFNLNGLNILNSSDAYDVNKLQPGLYIINGKKVIIGK